VYEVKTEGNLREAAITESIKNGLLGFLGELGYGKAGVMFVNQKENKGIIKINNKHVDNVKAGLALIKEIEESKVLIKSVYVSGILNKAKGYL